ncbi:MAG TPA: hypothetical protein VN638_02115, partial [Nitrospiraceae bacterium]|nr:hypothetical protein [Nitrospiraceae bacterium]
MSFVVPHNQNQLTLSFIGSHLQEISDESWGLDNVEVRVVAGSSDVDLTVAQDDIAFSDAAPTLGTPLTITTTVRNTGSFTVTEASLELTDTSGTNTTVVTTTIDTP